MKKSFCWFVFLGFFVFPLAVQRSQAAVPTLLLFDKKTNTLKVAEYDEKEYRIVKSYHATTGQVKGDKEEQGDLKTPEGIYLFTNRVRPPTLKPKFGAMAFHMNFPNPFDELAGQTGDNIMLHATDVPDRLKKNFDSEGCIVVNNKEILEIDPYVHLTLTPILVFSELNDEYLKPTDDKRLKTFFESWISDWESKKINAYIQHYHSEFVEDGKDRAAWKAYKASLNEQYDKIHVGATKPRFFRHPKYSMIMFTQNYQSIRKNGTLGHRSEGTKILYVSEERGELKIISENFTPQQL